MNSEPTFTDHHLVINGASRAGSRGLRRSRSPRAHALGMAQLPLGASTEIDMILKLK